MARIRTIKPEFFTSEDIVALSPLARLLYIALWCEADKEGRLAWKPRTFKMRYLPADDCDIDALARELHASGLVTLYGDGLAFIPSFKRHQHINPRESASVLPEPIENNKNPDASVTRDDASRTVNDAQGGREGKGREGDIDASPVGDTLPSLAKPKRKAANTRIPENFAVSERVRVWAEGKGHTRLAERLEHFVSYARRKGATYADWDEALMTAIREDWAKLGSSTVVPISAANAPPSAEAMLRAQGLMA